MTIDLVRPALKPSQRRVSFPTVVATVWIVLTILLIAFLVASSIQLAAARSALGRIDHQKAAVSPQWSIVGTQQQELSQMRGDVQRLQVLLAAPPWLDVLRALRAAMPAGLWLSAVRVDELGAVVVSVQYLDQTSLVEFVRRLERTTGIADVRLVATQAIGASGRELMQATIRLQVPMR